MARKVVLWKNATKKKLKGLRARGTYAQYRGKRFFVLEETKKEKTHEFDSPEAAKAMGWVRG